MQLPYAVCGHFTQNKKGSAYYQITRKCFTYFFIF